MTVLSSGSCETPGELTCCFGAQACFASLDFSAGIQHCVAGIKSVRREQIFLLAVPRVTELCVKASQVYVFAGFFPLSWLEERARALFWGGGVLLGFLGDLCVERRRKGGLLARDRPANIFSVRFSEYVRMQSSHCGICTRDSPPLSTVIPATASQPPQTVIIASKTQCPARALQRQFLCLQVAKHAKPRCQSLQQPSCQDLLGEPGCRNKKGDGVARAGL